MAKSASRWIGLLPLACLPGLTFACAGGDDSSVTCVFNAQECIEDARLEGRDIVLVDEEGNPVNRSGAVVADSSRATIPGGEPFWRLEVGDSLVEGRIALVNRGEGNRAVQLVSREGMNLLLIWPEEGGTEREVEQAFLAFGRGPTCALVRSDPPFHVRLIASEEWVAGRYSGMLGCPDFSALTVSGAFRLKAREES